jgi:hypothetical protein
VPAGARLHGRRRDVADRLEGVGGVRHGGRQPARLGNGRPGAASGGARENFGLHHFVGTSERAAEKAFTFTKTNSTRSRFLTESKLST